MTDHPTAVADSLKQAIACLVPAATQSKPWAYGWSLEAHRGSTQATLPGPQGPMTLTAQGIAHYESAMLRLLAEHAIQLRWATDWLWGDIADLLGHAWGSDDPSAVIDLELNRLRTCGPSLVCLPIANVSWEGSPCIIAGRILGRISDEFTSAVDAAANDRTDLSNKASRAWLRDLHAAHVGSGDLVAMAFWTEAQGHLAQERARQNVADLCALALLMETNPFSKDLFSLRGDANRPGVRGLSSDRKALEHLLSGHDSGRLELMSNPLVLDDLGRQRRMSEWYSASPVPLDALLGDAVRVRLGRYIDSNDAVPRRLRVAARWHSEAHWASDAHDAALALGVSLDAMVGARHGLAGQVLATRFAFLEPDPSQRRQRLDRWNEIYQVRSTVAHGGTSTRLQQPEFLRDMAAEVVWTSQRLMALDERFAPATEKDFEQVMDQFRLSEVTW